MGWRTDDRYERMHEADRRAHLQSLPFAARMRLSARPWLFYLAIISIAAVVRAALA